MTRRWRALLPCVVLAAPGSAAAHSSIEGINNFYNSLLHPLFVPVHLLLQEQLVRWNKFVSGILGKIP